MSKIYDDSNSSKNRSESIKMNLEKLLGYNSQKCKRCNSEKIIVRESNNEEMILQCLSCETYFFIPYKKK